MRTIVVSGLLLALTALAACGPKDAPDGGEEGARDLESVIYAGSNWYGHAPVWVGIREGIFAKAGFAVDARAFGGSTDRVTALEADAAQFASLGEVAMLAAMSQGRNDFYWVGNQDIAPGAEGLVAIGLDSIEALRGKSIACNLNSSVHITLYELLASAGLDIHDDVEVLKATDSAVVSLVRSGEAAAGIIWEPYFSELKSLPNAVLLGTDEDTSIYKRFQTMTGPDMVCASKSWVDADPERAKRFFHAYFEAVAWCKAHPGELIEIIAERVGKPAVEVEPVLRNFKWLDRGDQKVVMSDAMLFGQAQVASEILVDMGLIESAPEYRTWTRPDLLAD